MQGTFGEQPAHDRHDRDRDDGDRDGGERDGDRPPVRRRLTHAERSAATRLALLDATVECLAELGYAHTTTAEIVRRAGVSRGAQVHHYPTKAELVVAAVRHLFEGRTAAFVQEFDGLPEADRTLENGIELMWTSVQGPSFRAALELVVGSLPDDRLRPIVAEVLEEFEGTIARRFAERFPALATSPFGATPMLFAFRLIEGAALYRELGLTTVADEMVGTLQALSSLLTPGLASLGTAATGGTDTAAAADPADIPDIADTEGAPT